MEPIQEHFSKAENCYKELGQVRAAIGNINATEETFEAAGRTLAFMRLYCPENLLPLVDSQLNEYGTRKAYFVMREIMAKKSI